MHSITVKDGIDQSLSVLDILLMADRFDDKTISCIETSRE